MGYRAWLVLGMECLLQVSKGLESNVDSVDTLHELGEELKGFRSCQIRLELFVVEQADFDGGRLRRVGV